MRGVFGHNGVKLGEIGPKWPLKNTLFTSSPSILILPVFGSIKPVIKLKMVDLPTPFGPSIPKICPSFILKFMLSRISLLPYASETFSNSIIVFIFLKVLILVERLD